MELNDDVLFGEVWSREDKLPARDRSIVTVTALMASGVLDSSLAFHIGEAKKNGVTKEEMTVWYEEFKSTDKTEFEKAIEKTIQEVKFIPKIADIRARIERNPIDYYIKDPRRILYKNLEWGKFVD